MVRARHLAPPGELYQGTDRPMAQDNAYLGNASGGPAAAHVQVVNNRRPVGTSLTPPQTQNDARWVRDRHPWYYQGTEISGRDSGLHDPQSDGPARPSLRMSNRQWMMWQGSDATHAYDPKRPGYKPYGQQDGSNTRINGGQPGYYRPYGSQRVELLAAVPMQTSGTEIYLGGTPHGLHTWTATSRAQTLKTYRETPQMRAPRQDRLSNSTRTGQSYSAQTRHQGAK